MGLNTDAIGHVSTAIHPRFYSTGRFAGVDPWDDTCITPNRIQVDSFIRVGLRQSRAERFVSVVVLDQNTDRFAIVEAAAPERSPHSGLFSASIRSLVH